MRRSGGRICPSLAVILAAALYTIVLTALGVVALWLTLAG